jgi:hypothetical protein
MGLLEEITQKTGVKFRAGAASEIDRLRFLGVPEDALAFYRNSEPSKCAEINRVRLWPISEVLAESTSYLPGCYLQPLAFIVFATTVFGDAFCFDTKAALANVPAPVVLMAHDIDWGDLERDDIVKLARPVATTLEEFFRKYTAGTLEITPLYPRA